MFRGRKLSWLYTKHTIHWKTFSVHQAEAIMYCIQQMIQREKFCTLAKKLQKFSLSKYLLCTVPMQKRPVCDIRSCDRFDIDL